MEDAQRELEAIYSAIEKSESSYKLSYDVPVKSRGMLDFEIDHEQMD